jgi:hypothetical protein
MSLKKPTQEKSKTDITSSLKIFPRNPNGHQLAKFRIPNPASEFIYDGNDTAMSAAIAHHIAVSARHINELQSKTKIQ